METVQIIAILVIAVVAILYIAWKIYKNGLRQTAIDFIVEAERLYDNGGIKKTFVIEKLQKALPFPFSVIISEKVIDDFMEKVFAEIKEALHYTKVEVK
jgi:hypothetical protein